VLCVAFSPDGTRIVTTAIRDSMSGGAELKVWDAKTGNVLLDLSQKDERGTMRGERGGSVAFSAHGPRFVTGGVRHMKSGGTEAKVWDATTGKVLVELNGIKDVVLCVAFSQDGARIATGHYNKIATVWDAETGTAIAELKGHTGNVNSMAFSPDGKRVVTGGGDRMVRVWDTLTGASLAELKGHNGPVTSVSFSADGTRIVSASHGGAPGKPGEVFVWDARAIPEVPDEDEIAYRRLLTQPNPARYRAGYLAARAAKDDFAVAFYLNVVPQDERPGLLAQADADAFAALSKRASEFEGIGKLEEAVPLRIAILNLTKAKHGPDDPASIQAADNLGRLYYWMGQFDNSVPLLEEVLKYRKAKLGRENAQTLNAMGMLGLAYKDAGQLQKAIAVLEEGAAKEEWVRQNLLEVYALAGEHAKVVALCQKQLAEDRKSRPDADPNADLLAQLGRAYLAQKEWSKAEPPLRECVALREKTQPDAWTAFNAKSMLGGSLLGQKKYADAEPLLLKGYEGLKQREKSIPPEGAPRLKEAVERLVQLYEETDNKDEAAKWRKELQERKAEEPKPPPTRP
jgi:tetratricopeptide (TPR) repeat protein